MNIKKLPKQLTAYLAPADFVELVVAELGKVDAICGDLVIAAGSPRPCHWAQNIWLNPEIHSIESIGAAAKLLKGIQRNWCLYSFDHHRRATLIQEQLPHVSAKPLIFPAVLPTAPLGSWTLLEKDTILAASQCSSPFPNGEVQFVENKIEPPSRAYLKLWEVFTLLGKHPASGESCLDAGACPGGWSWVLAELGANVLSVDRSPLDEKVSRRLNVKFQKGDAFSVVPASGQTFDWIFCDVACYPEKLLEWVKLWLESGKAKNFVCTIKFQGEGSEKFARNFAAIPGSRLFHLFNNKHELTWVNLSKDS